MWDQISIIIIIIIVTVDCDEFHKWRQKHILAEVVTSASVLLTPVTEIMSSISFRKLSKGGQNCSVAKWGVKLPWIQNPSCLFFKSGKQRFKAPLPPNDCISQKSHTVKADFCHCHRVTSSLAVWSHSHRQFFWDIHRLSPPTNMAHIGVTTPWLFKAVLLLAPGP